MFSCDIWRAVSPGNRADRNLATMSTNGERAIRRTATRVKLAQAPKAALWIPIRRESGEGSTDREEPGAGARHHDNHRAPIRSTGVVSTARRKGNQRQWGRPVSIRWNGSAVSWACSGSAVRQVSRVGESARKPAGKADAGNRHVRFDERGWQTGRRSASVPAPNLDPTRQPIFLLFEFEGHRDGGGDLHRLAVEQGWLIAPLAHGVQRRLGEARMHGGVDHLGIKRLAGSGDDGAQHDGAGDSLLFEVRRVDGVDLPDKLGRLHIAADG